MLMESKGVIALGLAALAAVGGGVALVAADPPQRPEAPRAVVAADKAAQAAAAQAALSATPEATAAPSGQAAQDEHFTIKRILPIEGAIKYGEWHWDESNVPPGPIVVTVDLDARVISIFRGGYEIGAAAVLLGTQEKPTPLGVFPITQKRRHHTSSIYGAPMPYMQRLTNDGISLHATQVELGYASHGCIGMPEAFAKKVFETTQLGDRVFITRGKQVGMGDSLVS